MCIKYSLCKQWIHSRENSPCLDYYGDINVNEMDPNFYYKVCIEKLLKYYDNIFEETTIDRVINYLSSFDLPSVLSSNEDINQMKLVVSNVIDSRTALPV